MNAVERELRAYAKACPAYMRSTTGRVALKDLLESVPSLHLLLERAGVDTSFVDEAAHARWTEPEDRAISEAFWRGEGLGAIAAGTGRSKESVGARLRYLDLYVSERKETA